MIIDAHTHIGRLQGSDRFNASFEKNAELLTAEMKEAGVSLSLVLASYKNGHIAEPGTEEQLNILAKHPELRTVGSIDVVSDLQADLERAERWLKEKTIVAVKLYPGYQQFYPNDKLCGPIYELCLKYGVPVIFHSGDTLNNYDIRGRVKYSHPLHIDDVAVDFPELKIIVAHLGNPWLDDCAELVYKNDNVFADLSGLVVSEGLDSPYGQLMARRIGDLATYSSPDKLLYATDWPLAGMKGYIEFVRGLGFTEQQQDRIFYKNAKELFTLEL